MRFISKLTMTVAAIFFALSVSAQEVKENSSDTRLMKNVMIFYQILTSEV